MFDKKNIFYPLLLTQSGRTENETDPKEGELGNRNSSDGIYFYHPDHLGTGTVLTDANGLPYEFFLNLPFGETMAEQHSQTETYENRWKFTGHELDKETGLYYAGARYYEPRWSVWLSVDPLAEKYPDWSPYNYTLQNPINMVDPDGRDPWKPIVNDDGSTSYVKEEGDTESTLQSQYGLDKKTAENLYSTIDENGVISGEEVYNETGKDILQLDVTSSQATEQRMIDQISFAILSSGRGGKKYNYNFSVWDYFKNTTKGFQTRDLTGNWTFRDGSTGRVRIESFPMYRTQGIINIKAYPWYIGNYLYGNPRDRQSTLLGGGYQELTHLQLDLYSKPSGGFKQGQVNITTFRHDSGKMTKYLGIQLPMPHYYKNFKD